MKDVRKPWYGVSEQTDDPDAKIHWYVNEANASKNAQRLANKTGKPHVVVACYLGPNKRSFIDGRPEGAPYQPQNGTVEVVNHSVTEELKKMRKAAMNPDQLLRNFFRTWGYEWDTTAKGLPIWEEKIFPQLVAALKEYYNNHEKEIWPISSKQVREALKK